MTGEGFRLTLLRHGQAVPEAAGGDAARPLDATGRQEAAAAAGALLGIARRPDAVLASTALRTRQTAELLCAQPGFDGLRCRFEDSLYLASAAELRAMLADLSSSLRHVLVVGHNPGLSDLAAALALQAGMPPPRGLRTGAHASFPLAIGGWGQLLPA